MSVGGDVVGFDFIDIIIIARRAASFAAHDAPDTERRGWRGLLKLMDGITAAGCRGEGLHHRRHNRRSRVALDSDASRENL